LEPLPYARFIGKLCDSTIEKDWLGFTMIIVPDDPGREVVGETIDAKVQKVFDGDGFLASIWNPFRKEWVERIPFRFAFIDAPEMGQPLGTESMEFLHALIAGKALRLSPIAKESMGYLPVDQYKRMLCMAFLTEEMQVGEVTYYLNGKCDSGIARTPRPVTRNVELEMIVNGWAWVTEQYAFEREEEYFEAQVDAQRNRRGLWATENPEPPWEFKRRQKRLGKPDKRQANLFAVTTALCPVNGCGGHMVERKSARGQFLGCSNFPRCRFSRESKDV
jgi:micrococcal nuclease